VAASRALKETAFKPRARPYDAPSGLPWPRGRPGVNEAAVVGTPLGSSR